MSNYDAPEHNTELEQNNVKKNRSENAKRKIDGF